MAARRGRILATEKPSMTNPHSDDRPLDRPNPASASPEIQSPASEAAPMPVVDTAPPLAPAEHGQSPWWSAPSGKPFGIPDFAHEFAARVAAFWAEILAWLFPRPAPVPVPVKERRR
jgi:hypothetical protein